MGHIYLVDRQVDEQIDGIDVDQDEIDENNIKENLFLIPRENKFMIFIM